MGDRGAYSAILERSLTRPRTDINLHAFALLFAEIVRYLYRRFGTSTEEFERRLSALGRQVGDRFGELFVIRDRNNKRELKPINQLIQIQTNLWKPCSVVAHGAENGDIFVITLDASRIAPEALDAK
ncbi:uncharacterized protein MONBRDRAFT_35770 [Monosiga brevicollis MX1]|uniref:Uncharacterized protein n=1 Tax=Monosiga brevicollis TaxID=81824 RepID=A9URR0_MONBE|nr:uncharacterized protein MONBRDRAFT_35770 [Monosiga brevicollis MX1]EDQ91969.1 predicted protein [Monosiga brevicollis MX1]|eukprot:XP_001743255.1 hypothetical protein [Monosiga brevicollis MX1]